MPSVPRKSSEPVAAPCRGRRHHRPFLVGKSHLICREPSHHSEVWLLGTRGMWMRFPRGVIAFRAGGSAQISRACCRRPPRRRHGQSAARHLRMFSIGLRNNLAGRPRISRHARARVRSRRGKIAFDARSPRKSSDPAAAAPRRGRRHHRPCLVGKSRLIYREPSCHSEVLLLGTHAMWMRFPRGVITLRAFGSAQIFRTRCRRPL